MKHWIFSITFHQLILHYIHTILLLRKPKLYYQNDRTFPNNSVNQHNYNVNTGCCVNRRLWTCPMDASWMSGPLGSQDSFDLFFVVTGCSRVPYSLFSRLGAAGLLSMLTRVPGSRPGQLGPSSSLLGRSLGACWSSGIAICSGDCLLPANTVNSRFGRIWKSSLTTDKGVMDSSVGSPADRSKQCRKTPPLRPADRLGSLAKARLVSSSSVSGDPV